MFNDPVEVDQWHDSAEMTAGCTAEEVQTAIQEFYEHSTGTPPTVTLTCYDADDLARETCETDEFYACQDPVDTTAQIVCAICQDINGDAIDCASVDATTCVTCASCQDVDGASADCASDGSTTCVDPDLV